MKYDIIHIRYIIIARLICRSGVQLGSTIVSKGQMKVRYYANEWIPQRMKIQIKGAILVVPVVPGGEKTNAISAPMLGYVCTIHM